MVMVALEQHLPESVRIINDELAQRILPLGIRASLWVKLRLMSVDKMISWTERKMPGMWSGFMCRKRYIDDTLADAVKAQIETVVNLGAGFDTRAYRLSDLSRARVWEVDQSENINAKRLRLEKIFGKIPKHVTLVALDFDQDVLEDVLKSSACPSDVKTFFIWEAVTQYLSEDSVRTIWEYLSGAASGSRLVFTYVRKEFIDGIALYGHEYVYERMILKGRRSWLFGMAPEEVTDFLGVYGWRVLEHLGYEELAVRYVHQTGRKLLSTPLERIVYAEKM